MVRYPGVDARIGPVASSFAFGAAPPGSSVYVNGHAAVVAPDGGWIAYVPFAPGRFALHVQARLGSQQWSQIRWITVDDGSVPPYPTQVTIVQPGDALPLAMTARGAASVTASGPGFGAKALVPGMGAAAGTFSGNALASGPAAAAAVVYHVTEPSGKRFDVASHGTLEVASQPLLFFGSVARRVMGPDIGARPYGMLSPLDGDTEFTEPAGTQLAVMRRSGDELQVALGGAATEWIDRHELSPDRTLAHGFVARVVSTAQHAGADGTTLTISMSGGRPAFRVFEPVTGSSGAVKIYGSTTTAANPAVIRFTLPQHAFWGYRSYWSANDLVLVFRKPPAFAAAPKPALTGLHVVIDPGHSPDLGAVGCIGTIERDINLDIARRLATKLRFLGAGITMTRTSDAPVPLYDRPAIAERANADVLISVHNNAWPDGVDPATQHGYSVYYFQPHSFALAQAIHEAYGTHTDLPDAGLHKGDLALVRTSELPSVLTESAFITWPFEEMRLREAAFRDRLAQTMADGMERWAEHMRDVERPAT